MGSDLFEAHPELLGRRSDDILGWSLRSMCLEGPEEALTRTEHAQPALFALSFALWQMVADAGIVPMAAAGHSLGEYTALVAAGGLDYDTALRVVSRRGRAMAAAADLEPSGMAALIGADEDLAERVVAIRRSDGGRLQVANINAPGQIVVAGAASDIEWLTSNSRDLGVRRAIPLKVAGAFHSSFMEPAATTVAEALQDVSVGELSFPVWSNTTAKAHDAASVPEMLARQVTSPVRFSESLVDMSKAGVRTFVHVGPGDVTAGMARRSVPDAEVVVISSPSDIPAASDLIGTIDRT
jgi:[acyl-carrier-protein] S-malonyltransferase